MIRVSHIIPLKFLPKSLLMSIVQSAMARQTTLLNTLKANLTTSGKKLRINEDSLTNYNIDKRIINYYDEHKMPLSIKNLSYANKIYSLV